MFREMFSPIIKSTLLYLQYLIVSTQVAAGWGHGGVETFNFNSSMTPASSNLGEQYQKL
jgi:hypothetical protein